MVPATSATENPRVGSSILPLATCSTSDLANTGRRFGAFLKPRQGSARNAAVCQAPEAGGAPPQSLQSVLSHESLDRAPPNEDDVVIDESLTKLGAGHDIDIALAPGGIPHGEVHGDRAHLRVVVREVHE